MNAIQIEHHAQSNVSVSDTIKRFIEESAIKVERYVEDNHYKGYEPFDGLSSFLRRLTFGNLFLDRLLMQLVRQSPVNLRPLLGVKPLDSTIGRGYMARGYFTMYKLHRDPGYIDKAVSCLEWLIENKSPSYREFSWGKHFDFASRNGRYPTFEPITIWTALIAFGFLDAYELLKEKKYLDIADSACRWIDQLPRTFSTPGVCINYTALDHGDCTIHNQSMMAAALLAKTGQYTANREYRDLAREAMLYSCSRQLRNGAWYYGEEDKFHWVDNFHTGYNLDSLKSYIETTGDHSFDENLVRGLRFFKQHFIEENGRPKYYHTRAYPIDSQCAAQAIETLANFSEIDAECLELSVKVAKWTIRNMQDEDGHFYYRQYPFIKAKTPMLHWAQTVTYKALTLLSLKLNATRENG